MIIFDGEKWVAPKYKITVKDIIYDDSLEGYPSDSETSLNNLTAEQEARLEKVRFLEESEEFVKKYVLEGVGTIPDQRGELDRLIDLVPEEDLTEGIVSMVPPWEVGVKILQGSYVQYRGSLYKSIHTHIPQSEFLPADTPSLYILKREGDAGETGEPDPWVQPTDAERAYKKGARVSHRGTTWVSIFEGGNVWEPGEFHGWKDENRSTEDLTWTQPIGGDGRYVQGSIVEHNGRRWISTHSELNVWEPGVFGWEEKPAE